MLQTPSDTDYQAYFADAASAVQSVLAAARQHVVCALARDCSRHWFELLLQVARRGVAPPEAAVPQVANCIGWTAARRFCKPRCVWSMGIPYSAALSPN